MALAVREEAVDGVLDGVEDALVGARTATRACSQGEMSARTAFSSTIAVRASARSAGVRRKAGMVA